MCRSGDTNWAASCLGCKGKFLERCQLIVLAKRNRVSSFQEIAIFLMAFACTLTIHVLEQRLNVVCSAGYHQLIVAASDRVDGKLFYVLHFMTTPILFCLSFLWGMSVVRKDGITDIAEEMSYYYNTSKCLIIYILYFCIRDYCYVVI